MKYMSIIIFIGFQSYAANENCTLGSSSPLSPWPYFTWEEYLVPTYDHESSLAQDFDLATDLIFYPSSALLLATHGLKCGARLYKNYQCTNIHEKKPYLTILKQEANDTLASMLVGAANLGISESIKSRMGRPRPYTQEPDYINGKSCFDTNDTKSFISGHTALSGYYCSRVACNLVDTVAILSPELKKKIIEPINHTSVSLATPEGKQWLSLVVSAITSTVVGAGRIAAKKHYLTDVIAGGGVGAIFSWFAPKTKTGLFYRPESVVNTDTGNYDDDIYNDTPDEKSYVSQQQDSFSYELVDVAPGDLNNSQVVADPKSI